MEVSDFSLEFDLLYNNINSNQAPGLTELEKSILLTQAQESVLKALYTGSYSNDGFEQTELITSYLNSVVKEGSYEPIGEAKKINSKVKSYYFSLPSDVWFIVAEKAVFGDDINKCLNGKIVGVNVITHNEFQKSIDNPFRGPNLRKVLRLTLSGDESQRLSELLSVHDISKYCIRYIKKPRPIILEEGITIDGVTYDEAQTSELPEQIHRIILEQAVQLAKSIWAS